MTASLGLWISFISMLTFHPGYLGFVMDLPQWPKETAMIKELFTKILIFKFGIFEKKIQPLVSRMPSALLNVKYYFWKTSLRRITPAFSHACMHGRCTRLQTQQILPSPCPNTVIVPWSLVGEKNVFHHSHIWFCVEDIKNILSWAFQEFPGSAMVKNLPANAGATRDAGLIPGLGRPPGGGNGNPLQYSCLEIPMDRGAWWATAHGIAKRQTWLSDFLHSLTNNCFSQPCAQWNLTFPWKHIGEHTCTHWDTHALAHHLVWMHVDIAVQDPANFLCSLPQ